jgi:hypothetical protein
MPRWTCSLRTTCSRKPGTRAHSVMVLSCQSHRTRTPLGILGHPSFVQLSLSSRKPHLRGCPPAERDLQRGNNTHAKPGSFFWSLGLSR